MEEWERVVTVERNRSRQKMNENTWVPRGA